MTIVDYISIGLFAVLIFFIVKDAVLIFFIVKDNEGEKKAKKKSRRIHRCSDSDGPDGDFMQEKL